MEVSDQRLMGAVTDGGMQSEVERSNQRWRGHSEVEGSDQRWRGAIKGGGELSEEEGSIHRWREAIGGGGERSAVEASSQRRSLGSGAIRSNQRWRGAIRG